MRERTRAGRVADGVADGVAVPALENVTRAARVLGAATPGQQFTRSPSHAALLHAARNSHAALLH